MNRARALIEQRDEHQLRVSDRYALSRLSAADDQVHRRTVGADLHVVQTGVVERPDAAVLIIGQHFSDRLAVGQQAVEIALGKAAQSSAGTVHLYLGGELPRHALAFGAVGMDPKAAQQPDQLADRRVDRRNRLAQRIIELALRAALRRIAVQL